MQVTQSEVLCTVDDDSVGIGYVYAVLHDGSGEQHVVVVVREVKHHLLQFLRLHPSVTNGYAGIGYVLVNHLCQMRQVGDAIVHEVYLSVARHLEVDSLSNDIGREGVYLRLYGIAVGRRRLYHTEIAGTH